jgi:hypothetical protein
MKTLNGKYIPQTAEERRAKFYDYERLAKLIITKTMALNIIGELKYTQKLEYYNNDEIKKLPGISDVITSFMLLQASNIANLLVPEFKKYNDEFFQKLDSATENIKNRKSSETSRDRFDFPNELNILLKLIFNREKICGIAARDSARFMLYSNINDDTIIGNNNYLYTNKKLYTKPDDKKYFDYCNEKFSSFSIDIKINRTDLHEKIVYSVLNEKTKEERVAMPTDQYRAFEFSTERLQIEKITRKIWKFGGEEIHLNSELKFGEFIDEILTLSNPGNEDLGYDPDDYSLISWEMVSILITPKEEAIKSIMSKGDLEGGMNNLIAFEHKSADHKNDGLLCCQTAIYDALSARKGRINCPMDALIQALGPIAKDSPMSLDQLIGICKGLKTNLYLFNTLGVPFKMGSVTEFKKNRSIAPIYAYIEDNHIISVTDRCERLSLKAIWQQLPCANIIEEHRDKKLYNVKKNDWPYTSISRIIENEKSIPYERHIYHHNENLLPILKEAFELGIRPTLSMPLSYKIDGSIVCYEMAITKKSKIIFINDEDILLRMNAKSAMPKQEISIIDSPAVIAVKLSKRLMKYQPKLSCIPREILDTMLSDLPHVISRSFEDSSMTTCPLLNGRKVFSYDVNNQFPYLLCSNVDIPVFTIFDEICNGRPKNICPGIYLIKCEEFFNSGWYDHNILKEFTRLGIKFEIIEYMLASETYNAMKTYGDFVFYIHNSLARVKKVFKTLLNQFIGTQAKIDIVKTKALFTNSRREMLLHKVSDPRVFAEHTNEIHEGSYLVSVNHTFRRNETNIMLYAYIQAASALMMYKLWKNVKRNDPTAILKHIRTDNIAWEGLSADKTSLDANMGTCLGQLKLEAYKPMKCNTKRKDFVSIIKEPFNVSNIYIDYQKYDTKAIANEIFKENKLGINGIAGSGKSTIIRELKKLGNFQVLAFTNMAAVMIHGRTSDSFTSGNFMNVNENSLAKFDGIIFDECNMNHEKIWHWISKLPDFVNGKPFKKYFAYDTRQIGPVENTAGRTEHGLNIEYTESKLFHRICGNKIVRLNYSYRYGEDPKMMELIDASINDPKKLIDLIPITSYLHMRNISYANATKNEVNERIFSRIFDCKYIPGVIIVCKKKSTFNGIHFENNELFQILNDSFTPALPAMLIALRSIIYDNCKDIIVSKQFIEANFELGFCRTYHGTEGITIKEPFTIYDIENVLKRRDASKLLYTAITRATKAKDIFRA